VADIRVLVTGGRGYTDRRTVARTLGHLADLYIHGVLPHEITLVHGAATGADTLAAEEAARLGWQVEAHPADWSMGPSAGPARNKIMVALGAHYLVAFPGGTGTKHCRRLALNSRIPVIDIPEAPRG
jgi:hypothetical protein